MPGSRLTRRALLRLAGVLSIGLIAGCKGIRNATLTTSAMETKEALRKTILAVGPWTANEQQDADIFIERFHNTVSEPYLRDRQSLIGLAQRFPEGAMRVAAVEIDRFPPNERSLLLSLIEGLYDLLEVRNLLAGEATVGLCHSDRLFYVQAP